MEVMNEDLAVSLRQVTKCYGFRKNKVKVLKETDLEIKKGCIFGLLGPSGCGKTTLLSCIIGRIGVSDGSVRVFGKQPGSPKSNIPGSKVGYMPQEFALYNALTAKETLAYFGKIHEMSNDKIRQRTDFLLDFLNIPKSWRLIKNLSGGQQRRLSFAVALLHEPPLLILDEPTVGVDPILRQKIWNFLQELSSTENVTTIITTHYIEEANRAHRVGLMTDGCILITGEPQVMLMRYEMPTLEDLFLHLCQKQQIDENKVAVHYCPEANSTGEHHSFLVHEPEMKYTLPAHKKQSKYLCNLTLPNFNHIYAVGMKNFINMKRKWPALILQFLLPSIQIALLCTALNENPHNLKVAVVNEDLLLGKDFLSFIDNTTVKQINVKDINSAEQMVLEGKAWAVIHIWENFTTAATKRFLYATDVTDEIIEASQIQLRFDNTIFFNTILIKYAITLALQSFVLSLDGISGFQAKVATLPLKIGKTFYGRNDDKITFGYFMIPGALCIVSFFIAFGLTCMEYVIESREGLLDRTYMAGVNFFEIMSGHILSQLIVLHFQIGLVLIVLHFGFQFPNAGNILWVIFLTVVQGICGMTCGYFVSAFFQEEFAILTVGLGYLFSTMIVTGIFWPLEALPDYLAKAVTFLPQTFSAESLRCVFNRGWDITYIEVWVGLGSSTLWIIIFIVLSHFAVKLRW